MNSRVKILLVDDLKANLLALEGLLRADDVEILMAKSGTEALDLMMAHEFAVALIDVQMPGMSGFELAELMRGTNRTKNVPIIFVSATAKHPSFSFKGYESGAVDFLLKPLDTHAVKSKVNIFIELSRSQREQKELLTKLTKSQAELEQAVRTREEFMSIASHELKTPLTSMMLQVQMRKRNVKKADASAFTMEKLAKMMDGDEQQFKRLVHLIDDMLDISRITSGKLSMNMARFDLCTLVQEIVERFCEQAVGADCKIQIDRCESTMGIWDLFRIEQVVTNLITNALRYGAGKPIWIQVCVAGDKAKLVVRDEGLGIAEENQERIFQRFERAASGSEVSGLGLGLYIVRQILEAHKGSIKVESKLGQGSTFIVELPLE